MALAALISSFAIGPVAQADSGTLNASGFVVSPIYQNVTIGEHQAQARYVVTLSNATGEDQEFSVSALDFGSLNNSAGVAFLGESTSDFSKKYGLANWMKLDAGTVTVPAGASVDVGVTIINSDSLTPGGHYGAVMAKALTAPSGAGAQPEVGVYAELSSLILLIKQGNGVNASMEAVSQAQDGKLWSMPANVTDEFQSNGNVHVIPRGVVEVKDMFGREVERGALNVNSGIILPGYTRNYVTPLMKIATPNVPGPYTVTTTYRIDGSANTSTITSTFWYVGKLGVAIVVLFLLAAAGLISERRYHWWRIVRLGAIQRLRRKRNLNIFS